MLDLGLTSQPLPTQMPQVSIPANVGREDTGEQYSNMNFNVSPNFNLSTNNVFRVKVYVPTPSTPYTAPAQLAL